MLTCISMNVPVAGRGGGLPKAGLSLKTAVTTSPDTTTNSQTGTIANLKKVSVYL